MTSSAGWNESADLSLTMELSSPSSVYGARAYKYRAYISGDNEGQDLTFQNFYNNGTVWYDRLKIYSDGTIDLGISATFTSSAISLLKPVTIAGSLNMTSSAGWNESADLSLTMELSSPSSVYGARAYKYRAYISGDNEGQDLTFQNFYNNGTVWYDRLKIYSDGTIDLGISATFTSSAISLLKPVTITGALTVSGNINPTTTPTSGTWDSSDHGAIVPRGQYNVWLDGASTWRAWISDNGVHLHDTNRSPSYNAGGSFYSDGVNVSLYITNSATIHYRKY